MLEKGRRPATFKPICQISHVTVCRFWEARPLLLLGDFLFVVVLERRAVPQARQQYARLLQN